MDEILKIKIDEIIPYGKNPRNNENAIDKVAESIKEFGFTSPILLDRNNVIIAGHTRLEAAKKLNLTEVDCRYLDLTKEQAKAYRLVDNKTAELSEWNLEFLDMELEELSTEGFLMEPFGFENTNYEIKPTSLLDKVKDSPSEGPMLKERFIVPPFSYIDTKKGEWQERKRKWKELGLIGEAGRDKNLLFCNNLNSGEGEGFDSGISIFDPVLCEICYSWFIPQKGGRILDPFAGGPVRGVVADLLEYNYTGIELRSEQVEANMENASEIGIKNARWICDDSQNVDKYVENETQDLIFTCPPYFDLEVYSEDEKDISNMEYDDFVIAYKNILSKTAKKLKNNRFAIVVISDVRDKQGFYRDLTGVTKEAFKENGVYFYNDIILLNCIGTGAVRANRSMNKGRKVVRLHQNVLVFYKGDPKKIKEEFTEIDLSDVEIVTE